MENIEDDYDEIRDLNTIFDLNFDGRESDNFVLRFFCLAACCFTFFLIIFDFFRKLSFKESFCFLNFVDGDFKNLRLRL